MDSIIVEKMMTAYCKDLVRQYKKDYRRGWRSSAGPGDTLDNHNLESPAWFDGYFDYSAGRTQLHSMNCENYDAMTGHDHCTNQAGRV